MVAKYSYYIRKRQLVSCDGERRVALRNACLEGERVISYICIPFLVQHTIYEIEDVRRVCGVYRADDVDREAILDVGTLKRNLLVPFTTKVNLSLERSPRGGVPIRKRISIYASRFGTNMDTICTRIRDIGRLRFKFNSDQVRPISWAVKSATGSLPRSIAVGGTNEIPDENPVGQIGGRNRPRAALPRGRYRPDEIIEVVRQGRRRRQQQRGGGAVRPNRRGGEEPPVGPILMNMFNVGPQYFEDRDLPDIRADEVFGAANLLDEGYGFDEDLDEDFFDEFDQFDDARGNNDGGEDDEGNGEE
jgi:hypothetical protein